MRNNPIAEYGTYAKSYPACQRFKLLPPDQRGMSLEEALQTRRSIREFIDNPLTFVQLSRLLFAGMGKTGEARGRDIRTAPSAGARYPIELYVIANRVEGLPQGLYHYFVSTHELELLEEGNLAGELYQDASEKSHMESAGVLIIMTAVMERCRSRYKSRSDRYIAMEAGHISQNLYLQATSLGLGSVAVGAIDETSENRLLGLDETVESAVYMQMIGPVAEPNS